MKTKVYNRCHAMLVSNALFYPMVFVVWCSAAIIGKPLPIEDALAATIIFESLPMGFISGCVLLAAFNAYDYFTD